MPMHDWNPVLAGIYHAFHNTWIGDLQKALNDNLLPPEYYALGEQRAGSVGSDVLTLHAGDELPADEVASPAGGDRNGMVAVAEAPPAVSITQDADDYVFYAQRQRAVVIRHSSGDWVVAIIEIVSPANKHSQHAVVEFVEKVAGALDQGIHVLVIDPFPPGRHDLGGMHGATWDFFDRRFV